MLIYSVLDPKPDL